MSASHHTHYPATAEVEQVNLLKPGQVSGKGLQAGKVGLLGAVVIGVSVVAPAYTLTSGLGPTISTVGTHVPAILLLVSLAGAMDRSRIHIEVGLRLPHKTALVDRLERELR